MTPEEQRLTQFIEQRTGGRLQALQRQPRWRKAWYAELSLDGRVVPLYIRGDKQLDAEPYPGLPREAAILRLLAVGGVKVPHVWACSTEPEAIVMDRSPGVREVSQAGDAAAQQRIAEQYIEQLVRMHALPVQPFVDAGIAAPAPGRPVALAYLDANRPLYTRCKRRPQPLIEFALQWAERHAPVARTHCCFIHGDSGQFLFEAGELTALYDFEASHLGDPLADLAALRTRDGFEPIGADIGHLVQHYQRLSGQAVDLKALSFHTAAFALTAVMALSGPLSEPHAHALELEYLVWDLMTRRATVWAMAETLGLTLHIEPLPTAVPSRQALLTEVLVQTVQRLPAHTALEQHQQAGAQTLAHWARSALARGALVQARELDSVARLLGWRPQDVDEADAALERFVQQAGPAEEAALLQHFAQQLEDTIALAEPVQARLAGYALKPVRC